MRIPGAFIQGASAEQPQQQSARASLVVGLYADAARNGTLHGRGVNRVTLDHPLPPQAFTTHPVINQQLGDAVIGSESTPHLPGRLPPAAWDGEPGYTAPTS